MKVVLSWLREFVDVGDDVDAIVRELNRIGLAVDGVERVGEQIPGVVVAKVLALRAHPAADKIQLVDVDAGDGEPLQICCGAFNMAVGDLVPLAKLGTVMPNGLEIARRKLRGEWSNGMLCSSSELGLDGDASGIRILPAGLPLGAPLWEALGITADVVFDLDLARNRPDAFSHLGVARDLAASLGLALKDPVVEQPIAGPSEGLTVELLDPAGCPRFTARVVSGVRVGPSPAWMAERLTLAGMRPINNVVDVSNYVMLELGRPNHAYDLAKLGGGGFVVRAARPGETVVTLDDVERRMGEADTLICDALDRPIGIGGIMGGASTEIDDTTTDLALEMAWFDPHRIAATVGRLGLRSEASARFERGCDWDDMERAAHRFVQLLRETCPDARLHGIVDVIGDLPERPPVLVRTARVNALLGTSLSDHDVRRLLAPIGFAATDGPEPGTQLVTVPTWRFDSTSEIDVVEEVARMYGYDRIEPSVPASAYAGHLTARQQDRRLVRQVLVGVGCDEAMPNPFLAPADLERAGLPFELVTITNPLDADESILRPSLLPGLVKTVAYNESHRCSEVALFEIGHVYRRPRPGELLPDERDQLAVALAGREAPAAKRVWDELVAALALRDVRLVAGRWPGLHPTRTALVHHGDTVLGALGEVDPDLLARFGVDERVAWLELDLDVLLAVPHGERPYRRVSRFPSSDVDLAFVVPDAVPAADVEATIRSSGGELLVGLRLFDVYRGPALGDGVRSLAYSLRLQAPDRTLTDADVAAVRSTVIDAVTAAHGASLRS